MLAIVVNDNNGHLIPRGAFQSIASKLGSYGVRALA